MSEVSAAQNAGFARPLTMALVVAVGVFAFCAFLVLGAYAPDFHDGNDGQAHALSKSAIGFAAIQEALKLAGDPTLIARSTPSGRATAGVLVLTPAFGTELKIASGGQTDRDGSGKAGKAGGAGGGANGALRFGGPILVVMPKWETIPDLTHRGWVKKAAIVDPALADITLKGVTVKRRSGVSRAILHGEGGPFAGIGDLREGPTESLQTISTPGWIPVLTDDAGAVVLARDPNRPLYVLSDPDLLNTQGVKDIGTLSSALTILRALRAGDGPIMFDVTLNGLGKARSVLRLLFDPPFLAVTLSLAAANLLAVWQALIRFGPVQRAGRTIAYGKAALVDNTAALIKLAGREHTLGAPYAALTAELAAKAVGAPRDLTGEPLVRFLDRLAKQRGAVDSYSHLETQARAVQDRDRMAAIARRLYQWRLTLTHERG